MQLAGEDKVGVSMGGVVVPQVDFDVGFRYLGVWVDGAGDWGEERTRIEEIIGGFCCTVEQLRVPAGVVLYLFKAVLTPRVLYKLTLASLSGAAIDKLEDAAWSRLAGRLGGWICMDKRQKRDTNRGRRARASAVVGAGGGEAGGPDYSAAQPPGAMGPGTGGGAAGGVGARQSGLW